MRRKLSTTHFGKIQIGRYFV